jgi:predicted enzyme related to lactoylglutathione lyase
MGIGQFVWREASSTRLDSCLSFYKTLFDWRLEPLALDKQTATLAFAGERRVGSVVDLPKATPLGSHWKSFVAVDDVDGACVRCVEAGGRVVVGATDIAPFGRCALLRDPFGAHFVVWRTSPTSHERRSSEPPGPGEFCWEMLATRNAEAAKAFYRKVLGWKAKTFAGAADVLVFVTEDGADAASMCVAVAGTQPHWISYVAVEKVAKALEVVCALGGKVIEDRTNVPGMGTVAVIEDPAGAVLGLFEPRKL